MFFGLVGGGGEDEYRCFLFVYLVLIRKGVTALGISALSDASMPKNSKSHACERFPISRYSDNIVLSSSPIGKPNSSRHFLRISSMTSIGLSASEVVGVSLCSFFALALSFVSPFGSLRSDDEEAVLFSSFFLLPV